MAGTNQYAAFAAGSGANALTPSAWAALPTLIAQGFQPGVASSEQINTLLRQVSTAAAGVAQFGVNQSGGDALDNGSPSDFAALLLSAVQAVVDARARVSGADPVGRIAAFPAAAVPAGWLACNGQSVLRSQYPYLFSYMGTQYGAADASHFSLPDYRGTVLRMQDLGRGLDPGRGLGDYQADQNASHGHGVNDPGHSHYDGESGVAPGSTTGGGAFVVNQAGNGSASSTSVNATGISIQASGGAEARMKNYSAIFCMRAY